MDPIINSAANLIGDTLEAKYPAVKPGDYDRAVAIPHQHVDAVAEEITHVVAVILQSWLDAGSERDCTLEELIDPITEHVKGWSDHPDNLT